MKKVYLLVLLFLLPPPIADAHRSGCHRWHSCPSDSGSYICGDTGHCSGCPDNQYCESGQPRRSDLETPKPKTQTQPTPVTPDPFLQEIPLQKNPQIPVPAKKKIKFQESDYRDYICSKLNGEIEHVLDDGSRVDCLTEANAIEVDWAKKWSEAIGQALYYSSKTGKQAVRVD